MKYKLFEPIHFFNKKGTAISSLQEIDLSTFLIPNLFETQGKAVDFIKKNKEKLIDSKFIAIIPIYEL